MTLFEISRIQRNVVQHGRWKLGTDSGGNLGVMAVEKLDQCPVAAQLPQRAAGNEARSHAAVVLDDERHTVVASVLRLFDAEVLGHGLTFPVFRPNCLLDFCKEVKLFMRPGPSVARRISILAPFWNQMYAHSFLKFRMFAQRLV